MPTRVRNLVTWAAARIPTLLTLTALGGLVVWGRSNDWRLSPTTGGDQRTAEPTPAEPAVRVLTAPPSGPVRIEFPSADAVAKVGIQVAPAQVRDLTNAVTA